MIEKETTLFYQKWNSLHTTNQGVTSLNSAFSEKTILPSVLPIDGTGNPMIEIDFCSRQSNVG
jgi:hypothetical protein